MKSLCSAAVLVTICVAGCAGTSAPGNAPITPDETASAPSPSPAESSGGPSPGQPPPADSSSFRSPEPNPPGALGSPIAYDSTQIGAGDRLAADVRGSVQRDLDERTQGLGC